MQQQVRKYQAAGEVVSEEDPFSAGIDLSQIDPALIRLLEAQANERRTNPRSFLQTNSLPPEEKVQEYDRLLTQMYGADKPSNIYDLASTVGASMLASDPSAGAFRSMGAGFARYGLEEKERRQKAHAERRAIAMKAFELAKSDEDAANDLMNRYAIEVAKRNAENKFSNYYVVDPAGITVNGEYYAQGTFAPLTPAEAAPHRGQVIMGTGGGVKVPGMGALARYMTEDDARRQIKALGLNEGVPEFEQAVAMITAQNETQVGQDIIQAGTFMELRPLVQDGVVTNILMAPSAAGATPAFEIVRQNRLRAIGATQDKYADNLINVIPAVDRAMTQLMAGVTTGGLTEITLGLRQVLRDAFNLTDPALQGIEDIMGISNYLAPKMRPVGSGATSDMEFRAYQNAILSLGKTPEANYISLYAFKRMTENGIRNNDKELELLADSSTNDMRYVNSELRRLDRGIFEKLPETIDKDDQPAVLQWYNSLPDGVVIDNSQKIFDDDTVFVIKGWGKFNQ